jgi:hypothetical protein
MKSEAQNLKGGFGFGKELRLSTWRMKMKREFLFNLGRYQKRTNLIYQCDIQYPSIFVALKYYL